MNHSILPNGQGNVPPNQYIDIKFLGLMKILNSRFQIKKLERFLTGLFTSCNFELKFDGRGSEFLMVVLLKRAELSLNYFQFYEVGHRNVFAGNLQCVK